MVIKNGETKLIENSFPKEIILSF